MAAGFAKRMRHNHVVKQRTLLFSQCLFSPFCGNMADLSKLSGLPYFSHSIFNWLNIGDLFNCALVSRSWNEMISEYYDLDLLPSVLCLLTNLKKAEIEYKREHGYEATEDIQVDHFEWERFLRMLIKKPTRLKEQAKKEIIRHFERNPFALRKALFEIAKENGTILHFAVMLQMNQLLADLFKHSKHYKINWNQRNRIRRTAFATACKYGHVEIVELFLKHSTDLDIDLNDHDHYENTPLICATINGHHEIVRLLIQNSDVNGIDVNYPRPRGKSAFIWACFLGNVRMIQTFMEYAIEKNIDLNGRDHVWRTGYIHACIMSSGWEENRQVADMLRENANDIGLDLESRDFRGTGDDWIAFHQGRRDHAPYRDKSFDMHHCLYGCCLKHNPYPNSMAHEHHRSSHVHVQNQDAIEGDAIEIEEDAVEILFVVNGNAIELIEIE